MSTLPEASGLNFPPGCWPQHLSPVGYASALSEAEDEHQLAALAAEILDDPVALQQLSDRVFALLKQDLQQERERRGSLGR